MMVLSDGGENVIDFVMLTFIWAFYMLPYSHYIDIGHSHKQFIS